MHHLFGMAAHGVPYVYPHVDHKGVARRKIGSFQLQPAVCFRKTPVCGLQCFSFFLRPGFFKIPAQQFSEFGKCSRPTELYAVDVRNIIKLQEFCIFRVHVEHFLLRHNPCDGSADGRHVKIAAHRDTLVAFLHVEPVKVLVHLDRVIEALPELSIVKTVPLASELGLWFKQRHEVRRKRILSGAGLGACYHLHRYLHHAERFLRHGRAIRQYVVERRQERVLAGRRLCLIFFFSGLSGLQIIVTQKMDLLSL